MIVVSVKDMKSGIFFPPMFEPSIPSALRTFSLLVADGKSILSKFPHDFRLYHLGEFFDAGDSAGEFSILKKMVDLGSAAESMGPQPQVEMPFIREAGAKTPLEALAK